MTELDSRAADLVPRIAQKDEDALAELYRMTRPLLFDYIRGLVRDHWIAEEVLQDVYRQVWVRGALLYRPERGTPVTWLYMIARSRSLDALRKRGADRCSEPLLELSDEHVAAPGGIDTVLNAAAYARLRRRVRLLPEQQERLIQMAFFEGYSHAEIAVQLGIPLGTVKTRLRKAIEMLREELCAA